MRVLGSTVEQIGREHPYAHLPPSPDTIASICYTSGVCPIQIHARYREEKTDPPCCCRPPETPRARSSSTRPLPPQSSPTSTTQSSAWAACISLISHCLTSTNDSAKTARFALEPPYAVSFGLHLLWVWELKMPPQIVYSCGDNLRLLEDLSIAQPTVGPLPIQPPTSHPPNTTSRQSSPDNTLFSRSSSPPSPEF